MNPDEILALARHLASAPAREDCSIETGRRAAIGRAYYAVYTAARQLLEDGEGIAFHRDDSSHKQVRQKFDGRDPLRRQLSILLFRLFEARCLADYSDEAPTEDTEIQDILDIANLAMQRIDALWHRIKR